MEETPARLELLSPNSKKRTITLLSSARIFATAKKFKHDGEDVFKTPSKKLADTFEQCVVSPPAGIPAQQLTIMFEQYEMFLNSKKRAGNGALTRLRNRDPQILALKEIFARLKENQTVEDWQALLTLLVDYRIKVYTENIITKPTSMYGDALWAVQEHILSKLESAHKNIPNCGVLKKLSDYKSHITLCCTEEEDSMRKMRAAFGHYTVLKKYPQLTRVTQQVDKFITEIDTVAQSIYGLSPVKATLWTNDHQSRLRSAVK
ncbi:MAG: hypothetical protein V4496_06610, partial [Pseudomonadota bacterium]